MLIYKNEIYKLAKKKHTKKKTKPKPLSNVVNKESMKSQRNYKKTFLELINEVGKSLEQE